MLSKNNLSESLEKMLKSEGNIFADVFGLVYFILVSFFQYSNLQSFLEKLSYYRMREKVPFWIN